MRLTKYQAIILAMKANAAPAILVVLARASAPSAAAKYDAVNNGNVTVKQNRIKTKQMFVRRAQIVYARQSTAMNMRK